MKGTFSMFLASFAACGSLSAASPKPLPPDVESTIRRRIAEENAVGIVVALIDADGTRYHTFGHTSKSGKEAVTPKTIFEIGSITKVFTAIVYEQLVNEGKIRPEDPIDKYLPTGTKTPQYKDKPVTLQSLVNHTSGLPRLPDNLEPADPDDPYADYAPERLYAFLGKCQLERAPGSKYDYSNLGMGLLGHILERAAGIPYERLVVERICTPLGMGDTRITLSDEQKQRFAKGHDDGREAKPWALNCLAGAGALRSTAEDMVRFVTASMGLRQTDLNAVIARTYAQPQVAEGELRIAHGWHVFTRFGARIIWHNGGTGGFRSWCGFRPDRNLGVVVLTNSTHEIDDIARHLLEPKWELEQPRKVVAVAPEILDRYVGYYELEPGSVFHVTREDKQLFAQLTSQDRYPVYAEAEDKFFYRVVDAQLTFKKNGKGEVDGLVLHQEGDKPAKRLPADYKPPQPKVRKEVKVDAAVLATYAGRYQLAPGAVFDIAARDGKLFARLTGQPEFQLYAESETEFFYKVVDAQITFLKDENGKVTALALHQSGRSQKADRQP